MHRLEDSRRSGLGGSPIEPGSEPKQRRRMLAALAVLLLALILVVVKNREYLYPSTAASDSEASQATQEPAANSPTATASGQSVTPPVETPSAKPNSHPRVSFPAKETVHPQEAPAIATTERAVLPALQVEVVAGDKHRTVQPGNNSIKVDLQPGSPTTDTLPGDAEVATSSPAVDASERVRMSADATQLVAHQVPPNYPLLAKKMKVQGAVVLLALIGKEGTIQNLHVLSGDAILSSAAREAVKQWRFKPYLQAGQPVETQARITVNFTISTY